ncbi:sugar transporter [Fennellomyces sp. T-0311]|nr:sugar transporter [Fennellomyces sp. T-0311]
MTGVLIMPTFVETLHITQAPEVYTIIITTMMATAFVGALLSGPLADSLGRRGLAIFATVMCIVGDLLMVAADSLPKFYAGRAITGICIGMLSMVLPLYLTEVVPTSFRGRAIAWHQFCIVLGISVAFWVSYACTIYTDTRAWRIPLGVQLIPTLLFLLLLIKMPQSPRYLIQKHRDTEALHMLALVRGDGTIECNTVRMEFAEIEQTIRFEQKHMRNAYAYLFRRGRDKNPQRLLLGVAVQAFQQLTGANILMLYAPLIFRASGVENHITSLFANAVSGLVIMVFTIPAVFLIDRWSRRKTMIIGALVCGSCMIVMTICSAIANFRFSDIESLYLTASTTQSGDLSLDHPKATSVIFFIMFYVFLACYGCTWGPLGWIYPCELYSQGVRSKALGITTASNWFFNFGVVQLAPVIFSNIQWKVYIIYCVFCITMALVVYAYFPETQVHLKCSVWMTMTYVIQGKSLEEMDLLFSSNFKSYDPTLHHPRTAAEALAALEDKRAQQIDSFAFTDAAGQQ